MQKFNDYLTQQADILIQKAEKLSRRSHRQYVHRIAVLTVYGFQVAIPVVLGIFVGRLFDRTIIINHFSWTLNLVLIGVIVGFYNANCWFYHSIGLKRRKRGGKK